ncbi:MAG TPA: DUF2231 domain-containing protein [Pseudonocardiaceae bacterium]|jgi:uncharacterized membrane protein
MPLSTLVKGFSGKPAHAPLTDIGIGAYTAGVVMLVAGAAGFQRGAMAIGAVLAIGVGLIAAVPTIITGLVDLFGIPADSPARTVAWWHLTVMASATGMFLGTLRLQMPGYSQGKIVTSALVLGVISYVLLVAGGYLGGALTFVYGVRVLKRPNAAVSDALIPGRADHDPGGSG